MFDMCQLYSSIFGVNSTHMGMRKMQQKGNLTWHMEASREALS